MFIIVLSAIVLLIASANSVLLFKISWISSFLISQTTESDIATTDAERGSPVNNYISPKYEPGESIANLSFLSSSVFIVTWNNPSTTRNIDSPLSPC